MKISFRFGCDTQPSPVGLVPIIIYCKQRSLNFNSKLPFFPFSPDSLLLPLPLSLPLAFPLLQLSPVDGRGLGFQRPRRGSDREDAGAAQPETENGFKVGGRRDAARTAELTSTDRAPSAAILSGACRETETLLYRGTWMAGGRSSRRAGISRTATPSILRKRRARAR